jgi:GDSL-like Lipase/Acylhydrolase family
MKLLSLLLVAALLAAASSTATAAPPYSPADRESIEWCDIWISHATETNLPRVLLIGDSITRAYYPEVEQHLAGKAYVGRLSSSAFISDPALTQQIIMVLSQYQFDVIHFNNGMHGWQHSEQEYEKAFPKFLATIKAHAPHAKLIWASTTSLKVSPQLSSGDQTQATDERIAARNAIALKYITPEKIDVDDLNTLVQGHTDWHSDNVHFNGQGTAAQSAQVAAHIEKLLSR